MTDPLVDVSALTRRFGAKAALTEVDLRVERGTVHGLVGANGAGKTTLIKHLLGLLRAQVGTVRVFGLDPVADPVGVLSRVGYLSEDHDLPAWMRVDELLRYSRAFYPGWDDEYAESLRRTFDLDPAARVGKLSKGQTARAGLVVALAHRPDLLVLDEPSSGLDPIVRRDILGAVLRTIADEGRTVLFSSHLLDEVERVADHVTMIRHGEIVESAKLADLLAVHRLLALRFPAPRSRPPVGPPAVAWTGRGAEWEALVRIEGTGIAAAARAWGATIVADRPASLDDIFVGRAGASSAAGDEG